MKVAVWDTYVKKKDGTIMNFDIMVPDSQQNETIIFGYGRNISNLSPSLDMNLLQTNAPSVM